MLKRSNESWRNAKDLEGNLHFKIEILSHLIMSCDLETFFMTENSISASSRKRTRSGESNTRLSRGRSLSSDRGSGILRTRPQDPNRSKATVYFLIITLWATAVWMRFQFCVIVFSSFSCKRCKLSLLQSFSVWIISLLINFIHKVLSSFFTLTVYRTSSLSSIESRRSSRSARQNFSDQERMRRRSGWVEPSL